MRAKDCGICDYQGSYDLKEEAWSCRVDEQWHKRPHSCEHFVEYGTARKEEERAAKAAEIRHQIAEKESEVRQREFEAWEAEKQRAHEIALADRQMLLQKKHFWMNWWWQFVVFLLGGVVGHYIEALLGFHR